MAAQSQRSRVKEDFAAAHRIIALEGMHEGTWNHLSVLVPDDPRKLYVTPGNTHFSCVQASDILTMDDAGTVVGGHGEPNSSAWYLHYPIHVARPDAACVIHLHSTYATALFIRRGEVFLERISQAAATFYGRVAYFDVYDDTLSSAEEGARMARAMGQTALILVLRNHGFMCLGSSVADALELAYVFERACLFQWIASAGNPPLNLIPEHVAARIAQEEAVAPRLYLKGMKRVLEAREANREA